MANKIKQLDLDALALNFDSALFMEKAYGMKPDPWQMKVLFDRSPKVMLLCSRQSGKSTICAVLALHEAIFNDNALILIISCTGRQAEETFRKIKEGLKTASKVCSVVNDTLTKIELSNGSRILSLAGVAASVRGYSSVSLIIIDEASQVDDDLYRSVRPVIAVSQGRTLVLSTPWGKRGWFYEAWARENAEGWSKYKITADDCPRITKEFIEEEKQEIGEWWVKQEYYCRFVDAEDQLFSHEVIMKAISKNLRAIAV